MLFRVSIYSYNLCYFERYVSFLKKYVVLSYCKMLKLQNLNYYDKVEVLENVQIKMLRFPKKKKNNNGITSSFCT